MFKAVILFKSELILNQYTLNKIFLKIYLMANFYFLMLYCNRPNTHRLRDATKRPLFFRFKRLLAATYFLNLLRSTLFKAIYCISIKQFANV